MENGRNTAGKFTDGNSGRPRGSCNKATIGKVTVTEEYILKKEHVVIEDDVHASVDLQKSGDIECWSSPEYDLAAWNKEESCAFGLLKKTGETYKLSFSVANHGEYDVKLNEVLKVCKKRFDDMLDW